MKQLTEEDKKKILAEATAEFPDDRVMQEVHYSRLLRYYELEDVPVRQRFSRYLRPERHAPA
jgi:hypothetical protein